MNTLFILSLILVVLQFIYWMTLSFKLYFHSRELPPSKPTSVVVCAKNESKNLQALLPILKAQIHTNYSITVGDDYSTDNTREILEANNIQCVSASKNIKGKKQILEDAINATDKDFVLVTDADCRPASNEWIQEMTPSKNNSIVLSYGPLFKDSGLLNKFARYETFLTGLQYLSFALLKKPYMGVGRNLLFPKALFQRIGGLKSHKDIVSGDDDLFIQEIARDAFFEVSLSQKSFVFSDAKKNIRDYIQQKKRHISTSKHYRFIDQLLLSLNPICQILIYTSCLIMILFGSIKLAIMIILYKWFLQIIALSPAAKKLNEQDLLSFTPILDFIFLFYLLYFIPSAFIKDETNW